MHLLRAAALGAAGGLAESNRTVVDNGGDVLTISDVAVDEPECERVKDTRLDEPFERAGAVVRVVAVAGEHTSD